MSRTPETLELSSLFRISNCLSELTHLYKLSLPPTLQKSLLNVFNNTREEKFKETLLSRDTPSWFEDEDSGTHLTYTEEFLKTIRMHYLKMRDWTEPSPLPPDVYAFVMQLPSELFSLFWENPCHIIGRRYVKTTPDSPQYPLCEPCFRRDGYNDRVTYGFERTHEVCGTSLISMEVKDTWNWCANCVTTPLFQIYDATRCPQRNYLLTHVKNPMLFGSSGYEDTYNYVAVTRPRA